MDNSMTQRESDMLDSLARCVSEIDIKIEMPFPMQNPEPPNPPEIAKKHIASEISSKFVELLFTSFQPDSDESYAIMSVYFILFPFHNEYENDNCDFHPLAESVNKTIQYLELFKNIQDNLAINLIAEKIFNEIEPRKYMSQIPDYMNSSRSSKTNNYMFVVGYTWKINDEIGQKLSICYNEILYNLRAARKNH